MALTESEQATEFLTKLDELLAGNKSLRLRYGLGMERVDNIGNVPWSRASESLGIPGAYFLAVQLGQFNESTGSYVIEDPAVLKSLRTFGIVPHLEDSGEI